MASFSQSPFLSSLSPTNKNKNKNNKFLQIKTFKISSYVSPSNAQSSSNSQENPTTQEQEEEKDPIKLAFAKAKAYKKSVQSTPKIIQNPISGSNSDEVKNDNVNKDVPLAMKLALEKAKEYKKSKNIQNPVTDSSKIDEIKNLGLKSDDVKDDDGGEKGVPLAVKIALERAKEYKKNKGVVGSKIEGIREIETLDSGIKGESDRNPVDTKPRKNAVKKEKLTVSNIDFIGLGFSDKKMGRDLPAGLVPITDSFTEGDFPEVEILVGNTSKFEDAIAEINTTPVSEDDEDVYKPKVSTWGVFPRPSNISKAFGGGRTLRPGDVLETAEDKAEKQARTRQLLAAYKKKTGLNIDPKLKSLSEKALAEGDALMELGKLKEAIPLYEQVMEMLPFKSELYGSAALQWSICKDSLSRSDEARIMYEKLQSHPVPQVRKKAKQFVFGFQAMEMLKVKSLNIAPLSTGYQNYFEAFVKDKENYSSQESEEDDGALSQALPYVIFLVSPVILVFLIAALRLK